MLPAWGAVLGGALSAGSNLLGGILGNSSAQSMASQQMGFAREQMQFQRDLAQQGIRWKVADAQAAGIHPLFALGAPPFSASPISVSSPSADYDFVGRMGQDISRAMQAAVTPAERVSEVDQKLQQLKLQNAELQNQYLASQIHRNYAQLGPALPTAPIAATPASIAGLGPQETKPPEVLTQNPLQPGHQSGVPQPTIEWTRTPHGLSSQPPKSGKQEDELGAPLMMEWLLRNRLAPMLGGRSAAPPMNVVRREFPGATGVYWDYQHFEWRPTYHPSGKGAVHRYIDWRNQ